MLQQLDRIDPRTVRSKHCPAFAMHACLCCFVHDRDTHSHVFEALSTQLSTIRTAHHSAGGGGGGQAAKDALGNDIKSKTWLKTHLANDRSLAQGLKVWHAGHDVLHAFTSPTQGDPTYLVVNKDGQLENYGVNAVCTHLGCVVPWNGVCISAL